MKINLEKIKKRVKELMEEALREGIEPDQPLIVPMVVVNNKGKIEWRNFPMADLESRNESHKTFREKIKELNIPEYVFIAPTIASKDPPDFPSNNKRMGIVINYYKKDLTMKEGICLYKAENNKIKWEEKIELPPSNSSGFSNLNFYVEDIVKERSLL